MTICKLCQEEIKGGMLGCSLGTICMKCSKDISLAKQQPSQSFNDVLWCLSETYFRRGKGEEVNFEQVWKENNKHTKLIEFKDLFIMEEMK